MIRAVTPAVNPASRDRLHIRILDPALPPDNFSRQLSRLRIFSENQALA
jgi:hypothetical protein